MCLSTLYSFREPDENLYRGLPSNKRNPPRNTSDSDNKEDNTLFSTNNKGDNSIFGNTGKGDSSLFSTTTGGSKKTAGGSGSRFGLNDDSGDLNFGGYQPSLFGASDKKSKVPKLQADTNNTWKSRETSTKRTDSLNDLFSNTSSVPSAGNNRNAVKKQQSVSIFDEENDNLFSPSGKQKTTVVSKPLDHHTSGTAFPWDSDTNNQNTTAGRDKILPLRPRASNSTIHSKPAVRAISDFDDDLEEVIL